MCLDLAKNLDTKNILKYNYKNNINYWNVKIQVFSPGKVKKLVLE